MKKTTGAILFICIIVIFVTGACFVIYKNADNNKCNDTSSDYNTLNTNQTLVPETKTVFFRDENHAIYLDIPKDWKYAETYYLINERTPMINFELGVLDMYGSPTGYADVTYYEAGGMTLEDWTKLHYENDIKGEFGEDFVMTFFNGGLENGVEITGTNKLHPLWVPDADNIWSFTYFYYLHNDKIYEFELRIPQKYIGDLQQELYSVRDSLYFGKPFNLDEWSTYSNEERGFEVKYPPIWKTSEYWDQIGGFVGFDERENLFEGHKVTISTPNEEGYTSSLAWQTMLEDIQLSHPFINSVPAERIKGNIAESNGFYEFTDSVFVMSNGIRIEMAYREQKFNLQLREYFDQMVRTLRLI